MSAKPKSIQINIPNPCTQDWDKMTQTKQGRFCTNCQKTVIDFTSYTDVQLYEFFSKHSERICGRYLASQINRDIVIPYQPHSKLYKWVIAAGLVLMFSAASQNFVLARSQYSAVFADRGQDEEMSKDDKRFGEITGVVFDETGQPAMGVVVKLLQDGIQKRVTLTNVDGLFIIDSVELGVKYDAVTNYIGYKTKEIKNVTANSNDKLNIILDLNPSHFTGEMVIINYTIPLGRSALSKRDIDHIH